jgi:hypothetical protein
MIRWRWLIISLQYGNNSDSDVMGVGGRVLAYNDFE